MGIANLLQNIETRPVHVSKYARRVVAIDGYGWLHRGVHSCATELALGAKTTKHIEFFMGRVAMLLHFQVKPLLIFDGGSLPAKAAEEESRQAKRASALDRGRQLIKENRIEEARKKFAAAVDVSPLMAAEAIDACRAKWGDAIRFIVAPYEADAQLAYATSTGMAAAVLTEDSDLLCFGAAAIVYKLDSSGHGEEAILSHILSSPSKNMLDFSTFSLDEFRLVCALAGCDYTPSVQSLGIKTAYKFVRQYRSPRRVLRMLRLQNYILPPNYEDIVHHAILTWRHQVIYDPVLKICTHLTPFDTDLNIQNLDFLGRILPSALAEDIAEARLDPMSRAPLLRGKPAPTLITASLQRATQNLAPTSNQKTMDAFITKSVRTKKIPSPPRPVLVPTTSNIQHSLPPPTKKIKLDADDDTTKTILIQEHTTTASKTTIERPRTSGHFSALPEKAILLANSPSSTHPDHGAVNKENDIEITQATHSLVNKEIKISTVRNFDFAKYAFCSSHDSINVDGSSHERTEDLDLQSEAIVKKTRRMSGTARTSGIARPSVAPTPTDYDDDLSPHLDCTNVFACFAYDCYPCS